MFMVTDRVCLDLSLLRELLLRAKVGWPLMALVASWRNDYCYYA